MAIVSDRASALRILRFPASQQALTKAEVSRAFKREMLAHHPDKVRENTERVRAQAQAILEARDYLLAHLDPPSYYSDAFWQHLTAADLERMRAETDARMRAHEQYMADLRRQTAEATARRAKASADAAAAHAERMAKMQREHEARMAELERPAAARRAAEAAEAKAAAEARAAAEAKAVADAKAAADAKAQAAAAAKAKALAAEVAEAERKAAWLRNKQEQQELRAQEWLRRMSATAGASKSDSLTQRRAAYMARRRR